MPYNTGNPIPSSDAKDLSDNAENLDNSVNTALDTWTDRLGVERRTIQGQLKLLGYTAPDVYAGGLVFTIADNMATIDRNGTIYAPKPSAIPFTTSGTWTADDEDKFFVVQGIINASTEIIRRTAYTVDILNDDTSPSAFESDYYDSNKVLNSSAKWIKTGNTGTPSTFNPGLGVIYNSIGDEYIISSFDNVAQFGATEGTDLSGLIGSIIIYCQSIGKIEVRNDLLITLDSVAPNMQEIVFFGSGDFIGVGAYNIRQVRTDRPYQIDDYGFSGAMIPKLARGVAIQRAVKVVITGDSLTTKTPDVKDRNATQYSALVRAISKGNEIFDIDFVSRGIGGQTFTQLDGVATAFPDWYTDTGKAWLDYIEDELPDVVVISMGMNGLVSDSSPATLLSIVQKLRAMPTSPDIVFCTTPLPTSYDSDTGLFNAYASKTEQEARQASAGLVRSFCRFYGLPFFDVNRTFNLVRNGFDIRKSYAEMQTGESVINGAFVASEETRNFSLVVNMPDQSPYNTPGETLALRIGQGSNTEVVFISVVGGNLQLSFFDIDSNNYKIVAYDGTNGNPVVPIPNSAHLLVCELYDSKVRVYPTTATTDQIPTAELAIITQSLFIPALGTYETGYTTGNVGALAEYAKGINYTVKPIMNNRDMFGGPDGSVSLKSPYGGNGVNHPTSMGAHAIYDTTFSMSDLSVKGILSKSGSASSWIEYVDNRIVRMGGETIPVFGAQVAVDVIWPNPLTGSGYTRLDFNMTAGIPGDISAIRGAETFVNFGIPDDTGCQATILSNNLITTSRYATWVLDVVY